MSGSAPSPAGTLGSDAYKGRPPTCDSPAPAMASTERSAAHPPKAAEKREKRAGRAIGTGV